MDVYVAYYIYKEDYILSTDPYVEILGVFTSKEDAIESIKYDLAVNEMTLEEDYYTKEDSDDNILFSSKEESSEYRVEKHVVDHNA